MKDKIFADPSLRGAGTFVFDQRVASVFDDMVGRSVPGYATIQLLVADLACSFASNGPIYDLGCSTGASLQAIMARATRPLHLVGIDNSPEMLARCRAKLSSTADHKVELRCVDFVEESPFVAGDASVVILNLALQFVRPVHRSKIISDIFRATRPGGCLILVEKTVEEDRTLNSLYVDYYHRFKREMGYSAMEIAAKREALENVLIPFQRSENVTLLQDAGYSHVAPFFQWFNFSGFIAVKNAGSSRE